MAGGLVAASVWPHTINKVRAHESDPLVNMHLTSNMCSECPIWNTHRYMCPPVRDIGDDDDDNDNCAMMSGCARQLTVTPKVVAA